MANRKRKRMLNFFVNDDEYDLIALKVKEANHNNFSRYARYMLIRGEVVKRDHTEIKLLTRELANLARSINQIAHRANETRNIHETDVIALQQMYGEVRAAVTERLVKMMSDESNERTKEVERV